MPVNNSPNMTLPIPAVGLEAGPQWAADINNSLTIIDGHTHAPGSGIQITPSGININSALPFNANSATALLSVQFTAQTAAISPSGAIFVQGNELYYNDFAGHHVQLTSAGSVNAAAGNITGLAAPASASFGSSTYSFYSNGLVPGNLNGASVLLGLANTSSARLTLAPPASLAANYTITLPALPSVASVVSMDSSGNLSTTAQSVLLPPAGVITAFGGTVAPTGYLMCDGSQVSRTTYGALYAVIGNAFGYGDNSTTFNVPDMRGYFQRGSVQGLSAINAAVRDPDYASRTALNPGGNVAGAVGSYEADALQTHTHTEYGGDNAAGVTYPTNSATNTARSLETSGPNGARVSTETRPKNVYLNYIIKT